MELRHLRYFVAAAEEQHFSRAADRLCVTRPAVSRLISDLEDELGTQLFERSAHRIQLTTAGTVMLGRLRKVLADLAVTVEVTKRVGAGASGILTIGYGSATLQHPLFRAALKQVHEELPDVFVSLVEGPSVELIDALRAGTMHVGFTHRAVAEGRGEPDEHDREFARLPIANARLAVALPAGHALAGHEQVELAQLAGEDFIVVPLSNASPSFGKLAALCMQAGFEARIVQEVRNSVAQLNLVALGVGVGLLVSLPGARYPSDVRVIPLEDARFSTRFELTCLRSREQEPVVRQFTSIVQRLAAQRADPPQ